MGFTPSAIERMSKTDRITFGKTEATARRQDLEQVKAGALTLEEAQTRAKERRRPWGLTANQAASLVMEAGRSA